VGKYEVVAHIASGGMGAVYRARDVENGRAVALKVLNSEMAARPAMVERFKREAKHSARLEHENIVTLYEFDRHKKTFFLAMEYVDGVDLHQHVKLNGPSHPEEARQIVLQAARALRHAHDHGIIHRDIKPSNILLTRKRGKPLAKLTDFGLAREASNEEFRVTRDGTTVETLDYMSPEQARDSGSADIRSDLYSLGCTWYHLLTGQAPFPEGGLAERLMKIINEDPPDPRECNPLVSEETWIVLSRLLAKEPEDRYQTPAELIDDLLSLEGRAAASPPKEGEKAAKAKRPRAEKQAEPEATGESGLTAKQKKYLVYGGAGAAVLLVVILVIVLGGGKKARDRARAGSKDSPSWPTPPPVPPPTKEPKKEKKEEKKKGGPVVPVGPTVDRLPVLYKPSVPINPAALSKEVEAPWAGLPGPDLEKAPAVAVGRTPAGLPAPARASLAEALAAAPKEGPLLVELRDNGPLFELPVPPVANRHVIIRAAPGSGARPLLVCDVARAVAERKGPGSGLTFLSVRGGSLTLEGIDVAVRWPETTAEPATLFAVEGGDLTLRNCTVSVAGKWAGGLTVASVRNQGPGTARCRFTKSHVRGESLTALDVRGPGVEALFEDCMVVVGGRPLIEVRTDGTRGVGLRAVRSTLVAGESLVEVRPLDGTDRAPAVRWLGWDALLSRHGVRAGGTLLAFRDGAEDGGACSWKAVNCLYAGWQVLLAGQRTIRADEMPAWRKRWKQAEGDGVVQPGWPARDLGDPATLPARALKPEGPVAFAASTDSKGEEALGCKPGLLSIRDNWLALAFEPLTPIPTAIADAAAPEIPTPGDELYHGERLFLVDGVDLGDYLAEKQKSQQFGPRVVMHLVGAGERSTSPIRVKGSSLVLHFAPPPPGGQRLALKLAAGVDAPAMVEVDGGGLDLIGAVLRANDVPHLVSVKGGNLRLFRCKVEGPTQPPLPAGFHGAIEFEGSGRPEPEKAHGCSLQESVIVSGRAGVEVRGAGARVAMRQVLLVTSGDALRALPGALPEGRANLSFVVERSTVAAGATVLHQGDVPDAGVPLEPVVVQARDSVFLNPFLGRPNRSCVVVYEGAALTRGLLLWRDEGGSYDRRLHFTPEPVGATLPGKPEKSEGWWRLWGSPGSRRLRAEPAVRSFKPRKWDLHLLYQPEGRGANLIELGVASKVVPD
jgi:serine/threonine-protein kinase